MLQVIWHVCLFGDRAILFVVLGCKLVVCCSSAAGYLYRLNLDGKVMGQYELDIYQKPPRDLVPWSVILGPCNKLYITVDHAYEVPS